MDTTSNPHANQPGTTTGSPPTDDASALLLSESAPDAPVVLEARDLRCRYGEFEAVRGIDLNVRAGELFALLGTNGAGKTTTLETLEGHRTVDGGHVEVLGWNPRSQRRKLASRIGVMFQHSGLPGDLTPRELLALWRRLTPDAAHHLDVEAALVRVELTHRAEVRTRQLSGGERRRLELGLALINDPEVLFLDEPTTGMDPEARARTWQIIRDLLSEGVTIVLTTHYLEEAEALADRLAIMHDGRIAASGTLTDVIAAHPATIRARLPSEAPPVPDLGERIELEDGRQLTIASRHLQSDLTRLLRWAEDLGLALEQLQVAEASLAQVFHEVSGAGSMDGGVHPELDRPERKGDQ